MSFGGIELKLSMKDFIIQIVKALVDNPEHVCDPKIMYDVDRLAKIYAERQEAKKKVEQLYDCWEELEALSRW